MPVNNPTASVSHGVTVNDHLEFIDWMAANPDDAILEFRATGTSEPVANRTTATIGPWSLGGDEHGEDRSHTLRFGLPPEVEAAMGYTDVTDRYEAIEGALAALTACINGTISYNAIREGIEIDGVETTVSVPVDLRLLFGIHNVDKADQMYDDISLDVSVTGPDLTTDEIKQLSTFPARSPVYTLITGAQMVDVNMSVSTT